MKPVFFASSLEFRAWLRENHAAIQEVWVGFHKRGSGNPSVTWPESVDVALCYGWIDGIRKSLGRDSYVIRFTPRKQHSRWSAVNVKRARELLARGLMRPAGLKAFEQRVESAYSYEQRHAAEFSGEDQKRFRANRKAWEFFQAQPPWYRRTATYWVISAKKRETRAKRLLTLIGDSAQRRTIQPLTGSRQNQQHSGSNAGGNRANF
jgi:uncharacterized protein YdeI (YjbR/CyaY-like superfamily)